MMEVLKSELSLFSKVNYQKSIESSSIIEFRPTSALTESSVIEFDLSVGSDEYLDLQNIFLSYKAKIVKKDGSIFTASHNDRFSLINYGLNTIFDQLSIYIGSTLISQSSNTYPYLAYIEALTESTPTMIDTYLSTAGFVSAYKSSTYDFNNIDTKLSKMSNLSKIFFLYGRLHGPIFQSDKLLLNGVGLRMIFNRASDKFALMGLRESGSGATSVPAAEPKLKMIDISIFARKVKVNPAILAAHQKALQISRAIYPLKRGVIRVFNLASGQNTFVIDNCVIGTMPAKIIVGLISNDSYSGDYTLSPFKFDNYGLNYLVFHLNGQLFPSTPLQPNYDTGTMNYQREYYEFLLQLGATKANETPAIDYENYAKCYCLYALNLNPDFESSEDWISEPRSGFLNIELKFKINLTNALKLIAYFKFDSILELDANKNVFIDYN